MALPKSVGNENQDVSFGHSNCVIISLDRERFVVIGNSLLYFSVLLGGLILEKSLRFIVPENFLSFKGVVPVAV